MNLTSTQLKWIAVVTMVIDHGAVALCPETSVWYPVLRGIGRLAFPIYAFLIVEGYVHTRDWRRYLRDLLVLGAVSEVPFNLLAGGSWLHPQAQNVMFTLALGLFGIAWGEQVRREQGEEWCWVLYGSVCLAAWLLQSDYGLEGVALILAFWQGRGSSRWWLWPALFILTMGGMQVFALGALPILTAYHGEKGRGVPKYVFYGVYPAHLLLFGIVRGML